jgi:hypothetical protein
MSAAIPICQTTQPKVLSEAELEAHITDLTGLMELAYMFFVQTGDGSYRAEAARLLANRDAAILARSEATQYARHAAFERRLDEGVDFFGTQGARQGRALKQSGGRN